MRRPFSKKKKPKSKQNKTKKTAGSYNDRDPKALSGTRVKRTLYTGGGDASDIRPCLRLQRTDTTVTTVLPAFTLYDRRKKLSHSEHGSQIDTFTVLVLSDLEIHDISCSINTGKEKKTNRLILLSFFLFSTEVKLKCEKSMRWHLAVDVILYIRL